MAGHSRRLEGEAGSGQWGRLRTRMRNKRFGYLALAWAWRRVKLFGDHDLARDQTASALSALHDRGGEEEKFEAVSQGLRWHEPRSVSQDQMSFSGCLTCEALMLPVSTEVLRQAWLGFRASAEHWTLEHWSYCSRSMLE